MSKITKAYPNAADVESLNDDEFDDSILLDEDEELEQQFIPCSKKESKRNKDARMNKENRWRIKG